ncbi:sensor histidine kinase [Syntrophotalea carbinolica DSM 2380]|uniref:histidine kinase n=1 Tax=Syntrophotalea carbinolica (strain DSM 2380 / NBRC 103641 / GraBd1) TaxID=338963 RepID=Q3A7M3_SYNC1|nr:ATP-binding protein [Syntrophotalea carbinolica]ABA87621.1 sensor histidine kinase [Syntrophotalea carbinolica DSM 2380]
MKLSIKHRLFLAFLAAAGLVVASMFFITKFSFERSLLRYVNTTEQERLVRLEAMLETAYQDHGNWDFLRNNRRLWMHMLLSCRHEKPFPAMLSEDRSRWLEPPPPERPLPHVPPPPMQQNFDWRVTLLDAGKKPIFSSLAPGDKPRFSPLAIDHQIIGYLGLTPPKIIIDPHQQRFAQEQRRSMAIISLIVTTAAALLSLPLSRRMVKRITTLATATHRLAAGNYDIRVEAKSGDELGQLARDFNSLAKTLESNEHMRRRWVADISHELRTPLAVLRGEVEAVQDGVRLLTPQTLDTLHSEVLRLERLVSDLYELSLSDIGALQYRKTDIDLMEVLQQSLDAHLPQFTEKGLSLLAPSAQPEDLFIHGDPERLSQLFSNLLENSLRYTDANGQLQVTIEILEHAVQLNFRDSAPGVPPETLGRLFERLFRVEGSRNRKHGGAGLGLALCKNIVEAHNGSIEARPSTLGGLWVVVTLPRSG